MPYTMKNLREVKDSGPEFGFDTHAARFATSDFKTEETGFALMTLKPGQRMPFGHRHEDCEEVYVVVRGSGRFKLDDEVVTVAEMDTIRLDPQVMRAAEAGPDGLEYVAFGPHREGDGELDYDFWPVG